MKKNKLLFIAFLALCLSLLSCNDQFLEPKPDLKSDKILVSFPGFDAEKAGISPVVWNSEIDKAYAVNIKAVENKTNINNYGTKIVSNAHSDDFPGIYFIWDSKHKDNGYLKVSVPVFDILESFLLTAKQANTYWDFLITPADGQQITADNCYVFFIPKVNNNKNITMVFFGGWVVKAITEPETKPQLKPGKGFGTDPNDGLQVGNVIWAKTNLDTFQKFAVRPDMATCFYQWNRDKAWPPTGPLAYPYTGVVPIPGWDPTNDPSEIWINPPTPPGWRLPTEAEYEALIQLGSVWAEVDQDNSARGNKVIGRFVGPNCQNATMNNMGKAIFFPATGFRFGEYGWELYNDNTLADRAEYWSSTIRWNDQSELDFYYPEPYPHVRMFYFSINFALTWTTSKKNTGALIRPVRDVNP